VSTAAQTFGTRPSVLVGLDDKVLALDFDLAAAARLLRAECEARAALERDDEGATRQVAW
jgi:hypothetical protein